MTVPWTDYLALALRLVSENALAGIVVSAALVVPGFGIAVAAGRRLGWGLDAVLPASAAVSFGVITLLAVACHLAGVPLAALAVLFLGACAALWYAAIRMTAADSAPGEGFGAAIGLPDVVAATGRGAVSSALAAAVLAAVQGPYMGLTGDTFYHLAAVRSLLRTGAVLVTDPMYGTTTAALDPTSGTWHTWLAGLGLVADPSWVWGGFNVACAAMLVLALWALLRRISASATAATVVTWAWVVVAQYADFRPAGLPKTGSLALVFIGVLALIECAERRSPAAIGLASAAGIAVSGAHLGSTQLYVSIALAFLAWLGVAAVVGRVREGVWDTRPLAGPLVALGLTAVGAAVVVLPRLSSLGKASGLDTPAKQSAGQLVQWGGGVVSGMPGSLVGGGPWIAVLGSVLALYMAWRVLSGTRDASLLAGVAIATLPVLIVYEPIAATVLIRVSPYVFDRIAALLGIAFFVAAAWAFGDRRGGPPGTRTRALAAACLLAGVVWVAPQAAGTYYPVPGVTRTGARYPVYVSRLVDLRYEWGDALAGARPRLTPGVTFAGAPDTMYMLAGLEDVTIMDAPLSHSTYTVEKESGARRRADAEVLLAPGTSEAARRRILERWGVAFVALRPDRTAERAAFASMADQPGLFEIVSSGEKLAVLAVRAR